MTAALSVKDLRVDAIGIGLPIVEQISFSVASGEVVGLVGESGCGKTAVALALLGFARTGTRIQAESAVKIGDVEVLHLGGAALSAARRRLISYVPQDPAAALDPSMRIGEQLVEVLLAEGIDPPTAQTRISALLAEVNLDSHDRLLRAYPSQLSGGQQQRIVIAMALASLPRVVVLDEPTTGLDSSTQRDVLALVTRLCKEKSIAAIYVSHDLGVISHVADRVIVLYAGRIMEARVASSFFAQPAHPYSQGLLDSLPLLSMRTLPVAIPGRAPSLEKRLAGCTFRDRCERASKSCAVEPVITAVNKSADDLVRCHHPLANIRRSVRRQAPELPTLEGEALLEATHFAASYGSTAVLTNINLSVHRGECLAIVGESGSGKSTLARSIVGLHSQWSGSLRLRGRQLVKDAAQRALADRRQLQYVFQNPYGSLNPRRRIGTALSQTARHFFDLDERDAKRRVEDALDRVNLPQEYMERFPGDLSGGERQRVAVARALIGEPEILVCDEITSALDVSVQAAVLDLLRGLMASGLTVVFVTHNLAVVRSLSQRTAVLRSGEIVELGATSQVIDHPVNEYTRHLVSHTLTVEELGRTA